MWGFRRLVLSHMSVCTYRWMSHRLPSGFSILESTCHTYDFMQTIEPFLLQARKAYVFLYILVLSVNCLSSFVSKLPEQFCQYASH